MNGFVKLSKIEIGFYILIWFHFVVYGAYLTHKIAYREDVLSYVISKGYVRETYFGFYESLHEYMWNEVKTVIIQGWLYFAVYIVMSKWLRKSCSPTIFMLTCTIYTISIHWYFSSWQFVVFELLIYLSISTMGLLKQKILVWIVGVATLHYMSALYGSEFFQGDFLFNLSFSNTAMLITRAISIGLVLVDERYTGRKFRIGVESLYFYWYFPALIGCRMMTYTDFIRQVYNPYEGQDMRKFAKSMLKIAIAFVVWHIIAVVLCPFYLVQRIHSLKVRDPFLIIGGQLFHGLHFYMVYYIIYTLVDMLARVDGYMTTKGTPICIARVSVYSILWREFDRGLYSWIKEYIYRPLGNMRSRHIATVGCFGFIFVFHGVSWSIAAFVLLNYLQLVLEQCTKYLYRHTNLGITLRTYLPPTWLTRLKGVVCSVSFFISTCGFAFMQYGIRQTYDIFLAYLYGYNKYYFNGAQLLVILVYAHGQISCYFDDWDDEKSNTVF